MTDDELKLRDRKLAELVAVMDKEGMTLAPDYWAYDPERFGSFPGLVYVNLEGQKADSTAEMHPLGAGDLYWWFIPKPQGA